MERPSIGVAGVIAGETARREQMCIASSAAVCRHRVRGVFSGKLRWKRLWMGADWAAEAGKGMPAIDC